jgi:MFS family permease
MWLEHAPYPVNYQIMFLFAFVMALISHLQLMRVRVKPVPIAATSRSQSNRNVLKNLGFRKTLIVAVIVHASFFAIVPVMPLHLVRSLGATEGFMALYGLAEISAAGLIAMFTNRIVGYFGHQRMTALALAATAVSAVILGSAQTLSVTLLAGAISGAAWTAASIGVFGMLFESTREVPNTEMPRYTTLFNQVIFIAMFIGPMIGSGLVSFGLPVVLVILAGAVTRLLAAGSVAVSDDRAPRLNSGHIFSNR